MKEVVPNIIMFTLCPSAFVDYQLYTGIFVMEHAGTFPTE
jgi:hypothetical protein